MVMAKRNIVAGLILLAFGAWYAYQIGNLPVRTAMPNTPGPSFFPILIVTSLLVLSASLLLSGMLELRRSQSVVVAKTSIAWTPVWALTTFAVYLVVFPYAGFIVASIPLFAAWMYFYGARDKIKIAVFCVIMPVAIYVLFRFAFQIILPRGILEF